MGFIWFWIVILMLAAYVVLDGFDLGAGILYPILGRTEQCRSTIIQSIGPVWDGNEVWLIASGGTLFFAFPLLYASSFSGFYLPLTIMLWLLVLRALGIELRGHMDNDVWRTFFGGIFTFASVLLTVFFGAALANVIRGVPLGPDHFFFLPLWTNWTVGPNPGILDWYTIIGALVALAALATHGSHWIWLKTTGDLSERARRTAHHGWILLCILTVVSLIATIAVQPLMLRHYEAHPALYVIPALVAASLAAMQFFRWTRKPLRAFLSSCAYLLLMLVGAGAGLYPVLLPSSNTAQNNLTVSEALAGSYGVHWGLVWWCGGIALAILYFVLIYWLFRGKAEGHYHI